ncbi:unnamed protein product [Victoria cruziana]
MFMFGQIDVQLTSDQPNRDEIDFEFLGSASGQPYILQTDVFADELTAGRRGCTCGLIQRQIFIRTLSCGINLHQIVFMVDWVLTRAYRNRADRGVPYPRWRPMGVIIRYKLSVIFSNKSR